MIKYCADMNLRALTTTCSKVAFCVPGLSNSFSAVSGSITLNLPARALTGHKNDRRTAKYHDPLKHNLEILRFDDIRFIAEDENRCRSESKLAREADDDSERLGGSPVASIGSGAHEAFNHRRHE
jgi:hypothetical protein